MAFDSKGNLYVTNGDSTPNGTSANGPNNQSNNNNGGYINPDAHVHAAVPRRRARPRTAATSRPTSARPTPGR